MAKKVFKTGNYLYIEDTVTGHLISGRAGSFEFIRENATSENYKVKKDGFPVLDSISISDMIDENDAAYDSAGFETFKEANTGFKTVSGGSETATYEVVHRLNAGGSLVTATDGGVNWQNNSTTGAQTGVGYVNNTGNVYTPTDVTWNRHGSIPVSIPDADFQALYDSEKWDDSDAPEMSYIINGLSNGIHKVRLYTGENYGAASVGFRVFNVKIQEVLKAIDIDNVLLYGTQTAGMIEFDNISVVDGTLKIEFIRINENPQVCAIETLKRL